MKRPITVEQRENDKGEYWYLVRAGNRETVLVSQTYRKRWRAVRAARAFIASIAPAPVEFRYVTGPTATAVQAGTARGRAGQRVERVRWRRRR